MDQARLAGMGKTLERELVGGVVGLILDGRGRHKDKSQNLESENLFEQQPVPINSHEDPIVFESEVDTAAKDRYHIVSKSVAQSENAHDKMQVESEEKFLTLASFTRRFLAFLIDLVLIILISFVTLIFGLFAAGYDPVKGIINLSYIILPVYIILTLLASTYLLFLHAYSGKTVGKLIFGIRVVKAVRTSQPGVLIINVLRIPDAVILNGKADL